MLNVKKINKFKLEVMFNNKPDTETTYYENRESVSKVISELTNNPHVDSMNFSKLYELDYIPVIDDNDQEQNLWASQMMHLHNVNNMHGILYARRFIILIPKTTPNGQGLDFSEREQRKYILHVFIPESANGELPPFTHLNVYATDENNDMTGTVMSLMIPIKELYEKYRESKGEAIPEDCKDVECFIGDLSYQYIENMANMYNPYFFSV